MILAALLWMSGCSREPALESFGAVPDFTLTDQAGEAFQSAAKLSGHVWVADFMFTNCPGPCPRMSRQMKALNEALSAQENVRFVSFTVDPARDTPEVLAAYAKRYRARTPRWHFLTGPQAELHQLARRVFLLGNIDSSFQHSTRFVLIDAKSQIRGFYDTSDQANLTKLQADVVRLERERT